MSNQKLFEDITNQPEKWLLDEVLCEDYKRALSVLIDENHDDPYEQMLQIIECEVKKRVSEKLFKITEYAAEHLDECSKVCSECDVALENHGRYCEKRKSNAIEEAPGTDKDRAVDSGH
jgi:hypothetical protein